MSSHSSTALNSSAPSNTTTSSNNDLSTSPFEFSRMILDPGMAHQISTTFAMVPTATVLLRHFLFLSQNIQQLRLDMERHRTEHTNAFRQLMQMRTIQQGMYPILLEYRRRQQNARRRVSPSSDELPYPSLTPHRVPAPSPVPTPMTSPTAPPSDLPLDQPLPPSPSDSPQSVQILPIDTTPPPFNELEQLVTAYLIEHPPNANDNKSADNSPSPSFISFEPEQGTRENPIDIDLLPATVIPQYIARLHQTRSMPHSNFCHHCQ